MSAASAMFSAVLAHLRGVETVVSLHYFHDFFLGPVLIPVETCYYPAMAVPDAFCGVDLALRQRQRIQSLNLGICFHGDTASGKPNLLDVLERVRFDLQIYEAIGKTTRLYGYD